MIKRFCIALLAAVMMLNPTFATAEYAKPRPITEQTRCDFAQSLGVQCLFPKTPVDTFSAKDGVLVITTTQPIPDGITSVYYRLNDRSLWALYRDKSYKLIRAPIVNDEKMRTNRIAHIARLERSGVTQEKKVPFHVVTATADNTQNNDNSTLGAVLFGGLAIIGGLLLWDSMTTDEKEEFEECLAICKRSKNVCIGICEKQ